MNYFLAAASNSANFFSSKARRSLALLASPNFIRTKSELDFLTATALSRTTC
jgi:hypothetical protein